ncbi:MAG TPA: glycoside hydrolase family 3 N-terminal domain-containing protein [Candidatus Acidoferrales bacterium]|nr:glycoside hydrolase family 3 N-terminal domain-containing protein [Candidatus Acidoferrales bacterium]
MNRATTLVVIYFLLSSATKFAAQTLPYQDANLPVMQRVEDLMGRMTMDEKIGQMMQIDLSIAQYNPSSLNSYCIGSVLSGGGSDPASGNRLLNWANVYDTLQTYALRGRLKIPIIYGIDAVHGDNNVYGATIFPHNIGMGCTRDPELVKEEERATAEEVAATGIDWTFGPCIAVPRDERWGRTYEGFGETPELAQLLGSSAVRGFQGDSLSEPTSILACTKHYLGDGGTTGGIDQGNTQGDTATIRKLFLPGYVSAIDSGVGSIMVSFSSINGQKMSGSRYWITDVLKNELGFSGFVVSDWAAIDQLASNYQECVNESINAGIDMVMIPFQYDSFRTAMRNLLSEGKIDTPRVNDAVRRILTIKFRLGLFERPFTDRSLMPLVGSAAHRSIARRCVRESIVLLKKKDGILPLRRANTRILVAGSNADDLGNQCGGWTITWQGLSGASTIGTTILQGMRDAAPDAEVEYSPTGIFADTIADYSVVVIGETPYAEYLGYESDLGIPQSDVDLVKRMKSYGAPVIVVLVSGRPMILEKILHYSDVIFAAWLPGTEGEGVSDMLFGEFQPKGVLSHTWPKNMAQIPINYGDSVYNPLYPYGFGITSYADSPVGSPPVAQSAIVTSGGNSLELTFNKRMKDPSSDQSAFGLVRNGKVIDAAISLSLKNGDSTTIIVALDKTYYSQNDTAAISYNSGTLESADGGTLQPFNSFDVYNWSSVVSAISEGKYSIPTTDQLDQNYPNPFNPSTTIGYRLSAGGRVTLKVYDVLGREAATLVDARQNAGAHSLVFNAAKFPTGVYFLKMTAGGHSQSRKIVLLK